MSAGQEQCPGCGKWAFPAQLRNFHRDCVKKGNENTQETGTKIAIRNEINGDVGTKISSKKCRGRPPLGDRAMTNAERKKKWRENHRKAGA